MKSRSSGEFQHSVFLTAPVILSVTRLYKPTYSVLAKLPQKPRLSLTGKSSRPLAFSLKHHSAMTNACTGRFVVNPDPKACHSERSEESLADIWVITRWIAPTLNTKKW